MLIENHKEVSDIIWECCADFIEKQIIYNQRPEDVIINFDIQIVNNPYKFVQRCE